MASPRQLIFKDENADLPDEYVVPPSLAFTLSSVFARFDGSGAGGNFRACLDLVSQDGHIMARVPAKDQILAPGDLARVTWAPFLRAAATGSTPPATPASFDFAQISMSLGQLIPQSTSWTGGGLNLTTILWDTYLVAPGGADTEHSPSGAFVIDKGSKRLELHKTGMYWCFIEVGETGEWLGLTDDYYYTIDYTGAGFIWNWDTGFPPNGFEASAVLAEWYKAIGPVVVEADDVHTIRLNAHVAQRAIVGNAELGLFTMFWVYMPAMGLVGYSNTALSDQQQSF